MAVSDTLAEPGNSPLHASSEPPPFDYRSPHGTLKMLCDSRRWNGITVRQCFASPNRLHRNLTFRDVDDRSHDFRAACFTPNAMRKMRLQPSLHCREHRIRHLMLRSASTLDRPAVRRAGTSALGFRYSL